MQTEFEWITSIRKKRTLRQKLLLELRGNKNKYTYTLQLNPQVYEAKYKVN